MEQGRWVSAGSFFVVGTTVWLAQETVGLIAPLQLHFGELG